MSDHASIPLNLTGDIISGVAVAGTLMGYLPDIAAVAAMLWYAIQIFDWIQQRRKNGDGTP